MVFFYMCSKFSFKCQNLNSNIKCYLETYELSFNINWIEIGFIIFEILAYYISFGVLEIFLHIWIEQNGLIQIWQSEKKNKSDNSKLEGKYKKFTSKVSSNSNYFNHNSIQNLQSLWESWWIRPHMDGSLKVA